MVYKARLPDGDLSTSNGSFGGRRCSMSKYHFTQFYLCRQQSTSPPHHSPVIFVGGSAEQTNLIMAAMAVNSWPGEPMGATSSETSFQEVHCFTVSFRFFQLSSHRLKNGLGRASNRP